LQVRASMAAECTDRGAFQLPNDRADEQTNQGNVSRVVPRMTSLRSARGVSSSIRIKVSCPRMIAMGAAITFKQGIKRRFRQRARGTAWSPVRAASRGLRLELRVARLVRARCSGTGAGMLEELQERVRLFLQRPLEGSRRRAAAEQRKPGGNGT